MGLASEYSTNGSGACGSQPLDWLRKFSSPSNNLVSFIISCLRNPIRDNIKTFLYRSGKYPKASSLLKKKVLDMILDQLIFRYLLLLLVLVILLSENKN
jgi:hypothetical protein